MVHVRNADAGAIVRQTLQSGPEVLTALHVEERHRGASIPVRQAYVNAGIDVQDLNQAYESPDLVDRLARHLDPAEALPRIFGGQGVRVVYLTGWGSDPQSADALLRALHRHVIARPNLRIVAMNNASPIPPIFRSSGPTAHPDAEGFASHVATVAGIDRSMVSLHVIERDDPEDAQI